MKNMIQSNDQFDQVVERAADFWMEHHQPFMRTVKATVGLLAMALFIYIVYLIS